MEATSKVRFMAVRQLLLAKYLFQKGKEILNEQNPFSCGLALSLLQDSAEIIIWTIAKEREATVTDNEPFSKLWDSIKSAKKNLDQVELPLKAKMIEMNKARVNFKHYGILPDPSEAVKFLGYMEEFLRASMELFFDIKFDDVSLADLINNLHIKEKIKKAEQYLTEGNTLESVKECAEVENLISEPLYNIFPQVDRNLSRASLLFDREKATEARNVFQYISEYLNALRTLGIASMLNITLPDYLRFRVIIPNVSKTQSGSYRTVYKRTEYSREEADFCLKYVINYALAVQDKLSKRTQDLSLT
jgi:hypothetical protein